MAKVLTVNVGIIEAIAGLIHLCDDHQGEMGVCSACMREAAAIVKEFEG